MQKLNSIIPKFLIPLIFPSMIIGIFLSHLIISILIIIFLYKTISEKNYFYFKSNFCIFFVLFNLVILISSLFSDNLLISLESSLFYFRFFLFSLAIWYFLDLDKTIIKLFVFISSITLFFLISYGIIQFLYFDIINVYDFRISSFFGDEYILGSFIVRLFLIIIGLISYVNINNDKIFLLNKKYFILFLFIFCSIGIIISGERTAILYLLLILTIFFIGLKNIKFIYKIIFIMLLSIIFSIIIVSQKGLKDRIFSQLSYNKLINENYFLLFNENHYDLFSGGMITFYHNPLLGVGPKMYRIKCSDYEVQCSTHPHNSYIQLLAETGMLGFVFILILFFYISFKLIKLFFSKRIKINNDYFFYLSSYTVFFINLFPFVQNGNIFGSWISTVYFLPIGFFLYIKNLENLD